MADAGLNVNFVSAGFFNGVFLTYGNVFHDFPLYCPSQRFFLGLNVVYKFFLALDEALLSSFGFLAFLDFLPDFFNVRGILFFKLINDGLKLIDLIFKRLNVVFLVDCFLYFYFVLLWRS